MLPASYGSDSPWKRKRPVQDGHFIVDVHTFDQPFDSLTDENIDLDNDTKLVALQVSRSIVSVVSHLQSGVLLFACSGTIIACEKSRDTFISTILTSASILRFAGPERPQIRVDVYLSNGQFFQGAVSATDFHHNIAIINITSNDSLPTLVLRNFYDLMPPLNLNLIAAASAENSNLYKICPGDQLIALGRRYVPHGPVGELMAAPGEFSVDRVYFECEELFRVNCCITKSGIGGPLINYNGEVVGINFYDQWYTPFLPINIVSKCLERLKNDGHVHQPCLGMVVTNLYVASLNKLEKILDFFPEIHEGVIVETVKPGSPASSAGILPDDVIVGCNNIRLSCSLEFFSIMWDNARTPMKLTVIRASTRAYLSITLVANEPTEGQFYQWPIPLPNVEIVERKR